MEEIIGGPRPGKQEIYNLYSARRWPDMYTITHQWVDRIIPRILLNASISYLGGCSNRSKYNPTLAVSWEGFGTDYGALVLENRPNRLKVLIYNFADRPLNGKMRVWALEHGRYKVAIGSDHNGDYKIDDAVHTGMKELARADTIELSLPGRKVTVVELLQEEKLDPIFSRSDLAIAARELEIKGTVLSGIVHNIGGAEVSEVKVSVLDGKGNEITSKMLGRLAAPLDLVPQRLPFTLQLPRTPEAGWKLVVDPHHHCQEIYEGNNEVVLGADGAS